MKKVTSAIVATLVVATAGCASIDAKTEQVVDAEKIYRVNTWAKQNNTQVVWVSTPMRNASLTAAVHNNADSRYNLRLNDEGRAYQMQYP